jgi:uncharacterized membrane protein
MIPDPLHPAVVHFPIVFAVVLPVVVVGALWAIRRGARLRAAWALPLALSAGLLLASFVAVRTGEADEDRVENVVDEAAIHEHEEAAERFLLLSGVLLAVTGLGLVGGTVGSAARLLATAGSVVVLIAGVQVGRAGGELVYEHGAASAYVQPGQNQPAAVSRASRERDDD